jgi:Tol biopolymer transport system component
MVLVAAVLVCGGVPPSASAAEPAHDGSWIVFADGDGGISTSHPDGSAARVITRRSSTPGPNGVAYVHRAPDLSPDGTKVAFLACSPTTGHPLVACEMWTVRFDGTGLRHVPLAAETQGQLQRVSWSPDGSRLVLSLWAGAGGSSVFVANEDGSGERRLGSGEYGDWSPDGSAVVVGDAGDLVRLATDGRRTIVAAGGTGATWSPDGALIAFTRTFPTAPGVYERAYAVVHPDGSGLRDLGVAGASATPPAWSPDGRTIALPQTDDGADGSYLPSILYVDRAGNALGRLVGIESIGWANPSGVTACRAAQWSAGPNGAVGAFGAGRSYGDLEATRLNKPIVGIAAAPRGDGYWLLGGDGGVFTFGPGAGFFGSTGATRLNAPILAMTPTNDGAGYWLVAGDGGIFTFGDAGFHGSTGDLRLIQPVVALATTPSGRGYWLVAKDGGIFSFGDAGFFGSTGDLRLRSPIVAMGPTSTGRGYWLVAADGGVFSFGDATFPGSAAVPGLGSPVVAAAPDVARDGFTMATADGQFVAFGGAEWCGSPHRPTVSVAAA